MIWNSNKLLTKITFLLSSPYFVLCSKMCDKSVATIINTILTNFEVNSEMYEVFYYSFNLKDANYWKPSMRYMVYNRSHQHFTGFLGSEFPFKFTQPFHFVLAPLAYQRYNQNVMYTFLQLSMRTTTVFVYFDTYNVYGPNSLEQDYLNRPALKIVVHIHKKVKCKPYFTVFCNGYCDNTQAGENISKLLMTKSMPPVKVHSHLFSNANQSEMSGIVNTLDAYFLAENFGNDSLACERLLFKSMKFGLCSSQMMTAILLTKHHNMSLKVYSAKNETEWSFKNRMGKDTQYMQNDMYLFRHSFSKTWGYNLALSYYFTDHITDHLTYCINFKQNSANKTLNFELWSQALSLDIWMMMFGFVVLFLYIANYEVVYNNTGLMYSLVDVVGAFLGNSFGWKLQKTQYVMFLTIFGFFLGAFYSNGMLSMLTVAIPKKVFETIKDLLESGYKIMWFTNNTLIANACEELCELFRMKNLLPVFNDSIFDAGVETSMSQDWAELMVKPRAMSMSSNFVKNNMLGVKKCLQELPNGSNFECFILPETLTDHYLFQEIFTVNLNWLFESYSQMFESGLTGLWDRLAKLSESYMWNLEKEDPKPYAVVQTGDHIGQKDMLAILVCVFFLQTLGWVCLFFEVKWKPFLNQVEETCSDAFVPCQSPYRSNVVNDQYTLCDLLLHMMENEIAPTKQQNTNSNFLHN